MSENYSKWHRELELFSGIKPLIILEGNVMDQYRYPCRQSKSQGQLMSLSEYLHCYFTECGYNQVVFYSNLIGFVNPYCQQECEDYAALTSSKCENGVISAEFKGNGSDTAPNIIRRAMSQKKSATVTVLEMASHYIVNPERMDQHEVNSFNLLLQSALSSSIVQTETGKKRNLLILLVNKLNDLPVWFYLNNPVCKSILLEAPDRDERMELISGVTFPTFFDSTVYRCEMPYYEEHPEELGSLREKFVGITEGLTFTELDAIRRLCKHECASISQLCSMVDLYKYGVKENPWENMSVDKLKNAKEDFEKRIKGQGIALDRTLDVVKRAVTGMNGITSSSTGKPKGVLFFAGSTGTGKTETAKALAEKLFGDESACIRFDMSEYGQPHSDQKLMGAPPGYVGYEAGGQLTNAVKKNPFSIILFDEIEKAHTTILDKFLQILEDGRMTDGQGNTVYFSESVIIFTSNLGIYVNDAFGNRTANVTMDMDYSEVQQRIRQAIEEYFKLELGRPEILNRIGENIVVFDFIRPEAGEKILESQVNKLLSRLDSQKKISVSVLPEAMEQLRKAVLADLSNGGRGIGNKVESLLINPLSRYLFDHGILHDSELIITGFDVDSNPPQLYCSKGNIKFDAGGEANE